LLISRGKRLRVYYSEEDYAKRLIGNGWNIPTIVELIRPLCNVFTVRTHAYPGVDYIFAWDELAAKEDKTAVLQVQGSSIDNCIYIVDDDDDDDDDEDSQDDDEIPQHNGNDVKDERNIYAHHVRKKVRPY
jgi:hypothetical protein